MRTQDRNCPSRHFTLWREALPGEGKCHLGNVYASLLIKHDGILAGPRKRWSVYIEPGPNLRILLYRLCVVLNISLLFLILCADHDSPQFSIICRAKQCFSLYYPSQSMFCHPSSSVRLLVVFFFCYLISLVIVKFSELSFLIMRPRNSNYFQVLFLPIFLKSSSLLTFSAYYILSIFFKTKE